MKRKLFILPIIYFLVLPTLIFGNWPALDKSFAKGFNNAPEAVMPKAERVANEIIIKFKGVEKVETVKIAEEDDLEEILESYNNNPIVEYAEPNYLYRAAIVPSDSYYKNQWYLKKINAEDAWNVVRESPKVIIAIVDSGVQIDHPDLKDNIWHNGKEVKGNKIDDDKNGFIDDVNGWDFVDNVADPSPKLNSGFTEAGLFHGTIVAGIAAAAGNNAAGVAGVTWKAQIMPLRILDGAGQGNTSNVIKAIDYAIANGAHIINFSFVGLGYSKSMESAIRRAYDAGIIVVAAAGNDQGGDGYSLDKLPMYPVCYDGSKSENMVIGVAATDTIDQKASFSFYGDRCVDISAPGIGIFNTIVYAPDNSINGNPLNKYYDGYWSGTSMATPMVSGAFALVIEANPKLERKDVVKMVLKNVVDINKLNPNYLYQLGTGRLDVQMAVENSKESLSATSTRLLIAPYSNYKSVMKITDQDGRVSEEFFAYGNKFHGGVNVASGDVDGDGVSEIITGAGPGGGPHVRIFDSQGNIRGQFFAYGLSFRGGINVAAGDVDGDGVSEIITGAGPGGGPHVRIFDSQGNIRGQFFAYGPDFRGGVNVASGDVNRDGRDEIVTAPGPGGGPHIKIFKYPGETIGQFFAFNEKFKVGVKVAVADIDEGIRGSKAEIIVAPQQGGGPQVRIFDNRGNVLGQFFAYSQNFHGGVNLAAGDANNDGLTEIITGAGPSGAPHLRVFKPDGVLLSSFYAYLELFTGGVSVGVLK